MTLLTKPGAPHNGYMNVSDSQQLFVVLDHDHLRSLKETILISIQGIRLSPSTFKNGLSSRDKISSTVFVFRY